MPLDPSHSLADLGALSKPADTLIKKVSKAVGGLFMPRQIKRVADAQAYAALKEAETEIQITDLHRRAAYRRLEEDALHQRNMESIVAKTLPQLDDDAKPDAMDDDWTTNFFNKCRIVSDDDMQTLWSRVLAGEASSPGFYSKRTVNFLSDMDKNDAELFTNLCGFVWMMGDIDPLVFDYQAKIYNDKNINFNTLKHLDSIGLVTCDGVGTIVRIGLPKKFVIIYYGKPLILEMPKDSSNKLEIGHAQFTRIGRELAPICGSKPVAGFYKYVKERWKQYLPESQS